MAFQGHGITAPATVSEGGAVAVRVGSDAKELLIGIPGHGGFRVPVHHGLAEFRVPAGVTGGTPIFISDCKVPRPAGATVLVVGNQ